MQILLSHRRDKQACAGVLALRESVSMNHHIRVEIEDDYLGLTLLNAVYDTGIDDPHLIAGIDGDSESRRYPVAVVAVRRVPRIIRVRLNQWPIGRLDHVAESDRHTCGESRRRHKNSFASDKRTGTAIVNVDINRRHIRGKKEARLQCRVAGAHCREVEVH